MILIKVLFMNVSIIKCLRIIQYVNHKIQLNIKELVKVLIFMHIF